ncbi:MAG TPA: hypothetical protein VF335_03260 [Chitinivibrionales bacterium]
MLSFSEQLDSQTILRLLSRAMPYYLASWRDIDEHHGIFGVVSPATFNMRSVGSSSPVIEYVVRPHLHICCIISAFFSKEQFATILQAAGITKEEALRRLQNGLLWACETHLTGSLDEESFLERKRWGENWRSSLWAAMLGMCGRFAGHFLGDELLAKISAVVAFEADRFIDINPPRGSGADTKLEENASDALVMAWAAALNTDHPHQKKWLRSLAIWSLNIASCVQDTADHGEFLQRSVARYVSTQNLYPDMTAENHGFFHPDVFAYGMWVVLAKAAFSLCGSEPPQFLRRKNHQKAFDVLLRFCLPSGMLYAPAGQDIPFFMPRPFALAWGLWNNDPRAHSLTLKLLSWMDETLVAHEKNPGPWVFGFDGAGEGWELLFQSQVGFELAMLAVVPFPKELRFYSSGQLENAVDTRHIYPYVEVCYRRNVRTTRSVAWKALGNHPMIGLNIHAYPELIATYKADCLGMPVLAEHIKHADVVYHNDLFQKDGFETYGKIVYFSDGGAALLSREVRALTWGDEGIVVFDRIVAQKQVKVEDHYLSPIYLVNDIWTKNHIDFCSGSLRETFRADPQRVREISCPSFWARIEDIALFQFIWGRTKGLVYVPAGKRNCPPYWKNCRLDMLAVRVDEHYALAGDVVYQVGFFIGAGKGPRPFKCAGEAGDFFSGLVLMDGKNTAGLD